MKTCIFDLDGTLTDTLESITYSVQETLKEMGLMPITKEQCLCGEWRKSFDREIPGCGRR